jgi:putative addiction module component (TIGR02574 family)
MTPVSLDELLKLPSAERVEIALALWDCLEHREVGALLPLTEDQKTEPDRRLAEHEGNPGSAIPWEEVRRDLLTSRAKVEQIHGAMRMSQTLPLVPLLALLCGCAATTRLASPAQSPDLEPDCSYRAATSCWTLAARFPPRRAEPPDSQPETIRSRGPAVLASEIDSGRRPQ